MTTDIWDRFEAMLQVHAPIFLETFNPPATAQAISAAEIELGVRFPPDIRTAYLRHDGTTSKHQDRDSPALFPPFCRWASLSEVVEYWHMNREIAKQFREEDPEGFFPAQAEWWDKLAVRPVWWSEKWIPIGLSNTPTTFNTDLHPAPSGVVGQLIVDDGMQEAYKLFDSLDSFLETLIDHVERGIVVFGDGWQLADPDQSIDGDGYFDWDELLRLRT